MAYPYLFFFASGDHTARSFVLACSLFVGRAMGSCLPNKRPRTTQKGMKKSAVYRPGAVEVGKLDSQRNSQQWCRLFPGAGVVVCPV